MRNRRADNRRGAAGLAASIGVRIWAKAVHRPVDTLAILGAAGMSLVIIVNAVFLQSGSHPAPFIATATSSAPTEKHFNVAGSAIVKPAQAVSARSSAAVPVPQTVSARRNDPIAELIAMAPRVMAVQRVLSEWGYGQLKPSGILDQATSAAIEKFEREHRLPVTGRLSDGLFSEIAAMTGHPVE